MATGLSMNPVDRRGLARRAMWRTSAAARSSGPRGLAHTGAGGRPFSRLPATDQGASPRRLAHTARAVTVLRLPTTDYRLPTTGHRPGGENRRLGLGRLRFFLQPRPGVAFVLVKSECQWSVVQLFYVRIGWLTRREVAAVTAVLDDLVVDDLAANAPVRGTTATAPALASSSPDSIPAAPLSSALVWADSGHGGRPGAAPEAQLGARVVDLAAVEDFPLPGVDVADLVAMLASVPVADVSGAALVNAVAATQQAITMLQALQGSFARELGARTPDALRHVPDELACALVCTKRSAENRVPARLGHRPAPGPG